MPTESVKKPLFHTATALKWLRLIHLLASSVWLGATLTIGVFALYCFSNRPAAEFFQLVPLVSYLSVRLILPAGLVTLLGGVVYGLATKWGFFKFRWLAWKWLLAIACGICVGIGGIARLEHISDSLRLTSNADTVIRLSDGSSFFAFLILQIGLLVLIDALSIWKPHKKQ